MNKLLDACKILDSDYSDFGGKIERFRGSSFDYPDCSCGCNYFAPLFNEEHQSKDFDFGVCINPKSKRYGLLTFEHQAGFGCFDCGNIK